MARLLRTTFRGVATADVLEHDSETGERSRNLCSRNLECTNCLACKIFRVVPLRVVSGLARSICWPVFDPLARGAIVVSCSSLLQSGPYVFASFVSRTQRSAVRSTFCQRAHVLLVAGVGAATQSRGRFPPTGLRRRRLSDVVPKYVNIRAKAREVFFFAYLFAALFGSTC